MEDSEALRTIALAGLILLVFKRTRWVGYLFGVVLLLGGMLVVAHAADKRPAKRPIERPPLTWFDPLHLFPPNTQIIQTDPITALQAFTVADLQAALKDALAQTPPDTTAANCYTALLPIVASNQQNPLPSGMGAFQTFQKARDLANNISQIQSSLTGGPLNSACAPLVLSATNTVLLLAAQVGIKVAPMPTIP